MLTFYWFISCCLPIVDSQLVDLSHKVLLWIDLSHGGSKGETNPGGGRWLFRMDREIPGTNPPRNSHFFAIENRKMIFGDGLVSGGELLVLGILGSVTCIIPIVASGGYNASRLDIFTWTIGVIGLCWRCFWFHSAKNHFKWVCKIIVADRRFCTLTVVLMWVKHRFLGTRN